MCRSRARLAGRGAPGGARARAPPQSALGLSERKSRLRELPERQRHTVRYRRGIYSVSLPVKRGLGPPGTRKLATKEREDHELRLMTVATGTQFEVANALSVQNKPTWLRCGSDPHEKFGALFRARFSWSS